MSSRAEDIPAEELYLTHRQRDHKSPSRHFQAVGSAKLYLLCWDTIPSPTARPGTVIRRWCKCSNRMELKVHNFLCLNLASAIAVGQSDLGHFRLSHFLALARDLPLFCFSEEDLWFHLTLSMGCSVGFQHIFNYGYDQKKYLGRVTNSAMKRPESGNQLLPSPLSFKPQMGFRALPVSLFCEENLINFHITVIRSVSYCPPCLVTKLTAGKNSSTPSLEIRL